MEWPRRSKRKQRGKDAVGREAKKNRLEAPIQQGLPGTSVPLLDPDVDLLIGDGKTLSADVWLRGDAIAHSTPLALHVEDAVPMEEYVGQRSQTVLMPTSRMSPLTLTGNLSTLDSTGLTSISPLSFFESVLSETSQANPGLHPDEWLMSGEAEVVEEALGLINPNTTPALLGSSDETQEGAEYRGKVSAGVTEGQVYARAPSSYKMPKSDSLVEAVQEPAEVSSSIPSTSTDPEHGVEAGVLESSLLRSLLLSTSSGSTPSSSRAKTEAALMVVSRRAHDATETLFASRGWLEAMLRGVSDQLLRTHPFHRLPEVEPELPRHPFNEDKAAGFRRRKQNVVWLLSACRHLLKKEQLTSDELGALMSYTERLCGYATGSMPTYSTSKAAIDILGRAFMVLDTLHCLAEVLGSSARKEEWWPAVVRHIENAGYRGTSKEYVMGKTYWSSPVVNALRVALDYYRVGTRPPLRLVVGLKLAMLLSPNSTGFKESKWDPWREDALQWLQSIRPSAQINLNKQTVGI
ncbi:hypothetical protein EMWEY_00013740 [Eimeria maxima]|uniref:Uncharacterized protein n=1 Tax=Eimeria maxima TaxID=5804 RepID=U6M4U7_EIMMA|nr:hypothetical protein EMWEY_00013740 [Eimeria maxima]CDJ58078.1 hypothetical protein EMWEY_00013740 [Eimeria maxima]